MSADWQGAVYQAVRSPSVFPFFSLEDNTVWNQMTQNGEAAFGIVFYRGILDVPTRVVTKSWRNSSDCHSGAYLCLEEALLMTG